MNGMLGNGKKEKRDEQVQFVHKAKIQDKEG